MSDQNKALNTSQTKKPVSVNTLAVSIVILIAALGIGLVIKKIREDSTQKEPVVQNKENQDYDNLEESPEIVYTIPPVIEDIPEPVKETVVEPEPEPEPLYEEPVQNEQINTWTEQQRQDITQWISWLGTLSQEEREQLFRGSIISYLSLMRRWQNLPLEQVQQEQAVWQKLIQEWQNLPPEDRQQGIQNIQDQIEQWLQYNQQ